MHTLLSLHKIVISEMATIIDYEGHLQTPLPVWKINIKAMRQQTHH